MLDVKVFGGRLVHRGTIFPFFIEDNTIKYLLKFGD